MDLMLPSNRSHGSLYTTVEQHLQRALTFDDNYKTYIDTHVHGYFYMRDAWESGLLNKQSACLRLLK